jgi:predicted RND superfamily exporter protein
MGLAGVYLDRLGTAMVAAAVLGIAIDDSVHLLTQVSAPARRRMPATEAIRAAVLHVGRAAVTTSLALSLGFFVLASSWESVASFRSSLRARDPGGLVADLVILPAVVAEAAAARTPECA